MALLKALPSRIGSAPRRVGFASAPDVAPHKGGGRDRHAWRKWYKTRRWQKLRWSVLVRELFTCKRCGVIEADTSQLVADHKRPHRGNADLFWDDGNLQCLCKRCHDSDKQREERRGVF